MTLQKLKGEAEIKSSDQAPLVAPSIQHSASDTTQPTSENQGTFQRWFPGWGGWYGGQAPTEGKATPKTPGPVAMSEQEALQKEKEIGE